MKFVQNLIAATVVVAVFIYILHSLLIKSFIIPNLNKQTANIKKNLPAIIADAKLLTETPLFKRAPRTRNAQPLLNDYVPFKKMDGSVLPADKAPTLLTTIFTEHSDWAKTAEGFKKLADDPRLQSIDTSWMDNLNNYDYWDYGYNEEIKNQIADLSIQNSMKKIEHFTGLYRPDYFTLSAWMAVHMIKLNNEQRPFEALRTIRQFTNLIHTTGIYRSNTAFVALLLDREKMFVERLNIEDWQTFPDESIAAYKRLAHQGWNGLIQLGWMENLSDEILSYMTPENGMCGAAAEIIVYSPLGFYDYLAPHVFAEFNSSNYLIRAENLQEDLMARCGVKSLTPLLNTAAHKNQNYEPSPGTNMYFSRKVAAMFMLVGVNENNMKSYE